ncbi:MAG: DUF3794 domain-containing protein [Ruminococcaceae bacterium]|nr:DUF3794 domain-containing protein [Oscillospiraceae bacterium]
MEIKKMMIGTLCEPQYLNAQQSVESDFVLPDYYDTIGKLLKCSVIPVTEAVNIASDKISVAGSAEISFLYTGEDNKLYNYENSIKYTKNIRYENMEATDCISIRQEMISVNYKVLGPKRVEIRGQIRITAEIVKNNNTEFISEIIDDNIEIKKNLFSDFCPVNAAVREISLSTVARLQDEFSPRVILRKSSNTIFTEVKPISNKLYLSGNTEIEITYLSDKDNSINKHLLSIPVSEVVDFYGVDEQSVCEVEIAESNIIVNNINSDKENSFDVRVVLSLKIISFVNKEFFYISDMFSVKEEIKAASEDILLRKKRSTINKTVSMSLDADIFENENVNIEDCFVENIRVISEKNKGGSGFFVSGDFNALVKNSNGNMGLISRNATADFAVSEISDDVSIISFESSVLSCSALQGNDSKIHLAADVYVTIKTEESCKVKLLTDVVMTDCALEKENSEIVLYFAQKGETVWEIAKENKVHIESIKKNNSVTADILENDIMLLMADF